MSRDSNGNYTLPVGNPVVTDTVIDSVWANDTMTDLAAGVTNSLDRQGRGSMLAPLKTPDGTVAVPAHSFTSEFNSGMYRAATGDIRISVNGTDVLRLLAGAAFNINGGTFTVGGGVVQFNGGAFTLTAGAVTYTSGTYVFNGVGLELDGTDLYIGTKLTGNKVLVEGAVTAAQILFDNTVTGILSAVQVQAAIDQISAGAPISTGSVTKIGGGNLVAGVLNEIMDSLTYDIPLANTTQIGATLDVAVPDTADGEEPFIQVQGSDLITFADGTDTDMQFTSPARITLTSNGVDTWRY